MRKMLLGVVVCLLMMLPMSMWAQSPNDTISEIHVNVPKPGMAAQYEDGRKRHMQWHGSQKDPWTWYVWEVTTGDSTGVYLVGTFGHHWKDWDARADFDQKDSADAGKNVVPSVAHEEMSYWVYRADLSLPKEATPAKMATVTHYWLDPAMANTFTEAIKKINAGITKTKYPAKTSRWYQLANGGETPHYVIVTDRSSMADMELLDKSIDAMMADAYGADDGKATMDGLRKAIRKVTTEMIAFRPDLSYVPK